MTKYKEVKLDPWASETIPADVKQQLLQNIEVCRDAVVFFTACGSASGYGGHTGGAYDTVSALCLPGSVASLLAGFCGEFTAMMLTGRVLADARGDASARLLQRQVCSCPAPSICVPGAQVHSKSQLRAGCSDVLQLCLLCAVASVLAPGGVRFECHAVVCALLLTKGGMVMEMKAGSPMLYMLASPRLGTLPHDCFARPSPYVQSDTQQVPNQNRPDKFVPIFFDEAGHRVATQYLLSALDGDITFPHLKNYRVGHAGLPGHPELHCTPGVKFSSGRLGQVLCSDSMLSCVEYLLRQWECECTCACRTKSVRARIVLSRQG